MSEAERSDGCMLDTTVFNAVAKGEIPISVFAGLRLFATHVQLDELENTPRERLRGRLRAAFQKIAAESLSTETGVWDVSRWDQAKYPTEDSAFEDMCTRLKALDKASEKHHLNRLRDILIAETAIRNGLTLVSGDANLRTVTAEFGGCAIDIPGRS
jgi:predicted nucleic acid-binding protein